MDFDLSQAFASLQGLVTSFFRHLPYIVIALLVYVCFHIAARSVRRVIRHFAARQRKHMNVGLVLGRLAEGGIMLLGVLLALVVAIPSFEPAQLIQLLGISGVAIGFAFRDILQNFLAGLLILLTEPFKIGDQIVVGSFEGTVEEIETRATTIKTYDGRLVVIPNTNLFTQSVVVNTAFPTRRLQYDIGIGYGDDIALAKRAVLDALKGVHGVLKTPAPEALVVGLADYSVTIRARWWISPPRRADVMESTDNALESIKNKLTEAGIDLPFPTRQILFHDQTEDTDGDRSQQREGWPAGSGKVPGSRSIAGAMLRRRRGQNEEAEADPEVARSSTSSAA